jgi:FixJ family two-component response regulator
MKQALVHLVEDDLSVRTALSRVLQAAGFDVRAYTSAVEFLVAERDDRPGCVVLDVGLPGMSGIELQAAMAKKDSPPPIVFVTGRGSVDIGVRAMKAGAVDFLTKPVQREALLSAVQTAVASDAKHRERSEEVRTAREKFERLTRREREVFAQVVRGRLNKQIAGDFGTSVRTVKAHRGQVMSKMEVRSLVELVRVAAVLRNDVDE